MDVLDERWYAWAGAEWEGMPEFVLKDLLAWKQIKINFACQADLDKFAELIGQNLTKKTASTWFPEQEELVVVGRMRYAGTDEAGQVQSW